MSAQIHRPEWQRIEIWLLWAAVVAAVLLLLAPRSADFETPVSVHSTETRMPVHEASPRSLPFTALDVVAYFSTTLEMSPQNASGGTVIFESQQVTAPEDYWRIQISAERKSVVVEFVTRGDYGMSLAREFFESPLFERDEFEQLYGLFNQARTGAIANLRRFTVGMNLRTESKQDILLVRFMAPGST